MPGALAVNVGVDNRHRRIDADRAARIDDLERPLRLRHFQVRLILKCEVHIADPLLGKGCRGSPGAGVENWGALVDRRHKLPGILLAAACGQGCAPCGQKAVFAIAGGFWIGGDDRDVAAIQIGPVGNLLGVALAHHKHHDGVVGHRGVVKPVLPVGPDQLRLGDRLDVGPGRQGHHVGVETVDHCPRLAPRTGVRLLDGNLCAMLLGIVAHKRSIDVAIEFPSGVVGDVEEFNPGRLALPLRGLSGAAQASKSQGNPEGHVPDKVPEKGLICCRFAGWRAIFHR